MTYMPRHSAGEVITRRAAIAGISIGALLALVFTAPSATAAASPPPDTCLDQVDFPGYSVMLGTDGADLLLGTPEGEVIFGLGGNDVILARGGDDIICGGPAVTSSWAVLVTTWSTANWTAIPRVERAVPQQPRLIARTGRDLPLLLGCLRVRLTG